MKLGAACPSPWRSQAAHCSHHAGMEQGRYLIAQAGAIPPLVLALTNGSDFCKEHAARSVPHERALVQHGPRSASKGAVLLCRTHALFIAELCAGASGSSAGATTPSLRSAAPVPFPASSTSWPRYDVPSACQAGCPRTLVFRRKLRKWFPPSCSLFRPFPCPST